MQSNDPDPKMGRPKKQAKRKRHFKKAKQVRDALARNTADSIDSGLASDGSAVEQTRSSVKDDGGLVSAATVEDDGEPVSAASMEDDGGPVSVATVEDDGEPAESVEDDGEPVSAAAAHAEAASGSIHEDRAV